ncbi:MAG TPA: class I SAM-dependent methyltransferase [Acidimicrobiales bacterium]|nr:class I SAM-dependent methyltransferase [Acidimicrobiales bacterium]
MTAPDTARARYEREGESTERYGSESPWDARYHRRRFGVVAAMLSDALRPGDRFLDVGCGTGEYLAEGLRNGSTSIGTDLSLTYCARARRQGGEVVQADGARLPFADRSIDVVLCSEVIEHVDPAVASLLVRELARVCSRSLIITTPNESAMARRITRRLAPAKMAELDASVGHINLLTFTGLRDLVSLDGWMIAEQRTVHIAPPVLGEALHLPRWIQPVAGLGERAAERLAPSAGNVSLVRLRRH